MIKECIIPDESKFSKILKLLGLRKTNKLKCRVELLIDKEVYVVPYNTIPLMSDKSKLIINIDNLECYSNLELDDDSYKIVNEVKSKLYIKRFKEEIIPLKKFNIFYYESESPTKLCKVNVLVNKLCKIPSEFTIIDSIDEYYKLEVPGVYKYSPYINEVTLEYREELDKYLNMIG